MSKDELDNLRFCDKVVCIPSKTVCKFLGREGIYLIMVKVKDLFIMKIPKNVFLKNYQKGGA